MLSFVDERDSMRLHGILHKINVTLHKIVVIFTEFGFNGSAKCNHICGNDYSTVVLLSSSVKLL